jgi:hypothetical protein
MARSRVTGHVRPAPPFHHRGRRAAGRGRPGEDALPEVAVEQMNGTTQQVAANAGESASAAEELASQAAAMSGVVGPFQLGGAATPAAGARPGSPAAGPARRAPTGRVERRGTTAAPRAAVSAALATSRWGMDADADTTAAAGAYRSAATPG